MFVRFSSRSGFPDTTLIARPFKKSDDYIVAILLITIPGLEYILVSLS